MPTVYFASADALFATVAARWRTDLAARPRGVRYCLALSGGRSAQGLFMALTAVWTPPPDGLVDVHFFWADERCVPSADSASNFGLAQHGLLGPLGVPPAQIHRVHGELEPGRAAAEASLELCQTAPTQHQGIPVLDLVLLGMGEDGHVASLFPEVPMIEPAAAGSEAVYRAVASPKLPRDRVTLDYATLAAARRVWVLVTGADKQDALKRSLRPDGKTPLARLGRLRGVTWVFVDQRLSPL